MFDIRLRRSRGGGRGGKADEVGGIVKYIDTLSFMHNNPPVSLTADSLARREAAPLLSALPTFSPAIGGNRPLHKGALSLRRDFSSLKFYPTTRLSRGFRLQ